MAHPIHRHSAIARPVEPKYPTNLAILVIMGVALVGLAVTGIVRGAPAAAALLGGLLGALVVFATWAMGRELAPDDNAAAFVALVPVSAVIVLGTSPDVLAPMLVLGLMRVVNRTVGPVATWIDRVMLLALVLVLARDGYGWTIGAVAVIAFGLDALLPTPCPHGWRWTAGAVLATAIGVLTGEPRFAVASLGPWAIGAIVLAVAFALVVATQPVPRSCCDVDESVTLRRDRVQGGMVVALLAAVATLLGGDDTVRAGAILWAGLLGTVLTRPWHLRSRRAPQAQ